MNATERLALLASVQAMSLLMQCIDRRIEEDPLDMHIVTDDRLAYLHFQRVVEVMKSYLLDSNGCC